MNKSKGKKTEQSEVPEKEKEDLTESKTEDGRCKYSSGKVNGLEKCIGCGVGYRYDTYIQTWIHIFNFYYVSLLIKTILSFIAFQL